ncbi:MAG: MOSC domain-containing protein [Gemmatimonadota bacterium]|nr:MOSC domain-containing protein [Gemmatimonadota bacterium]MXW04649.1 MOSC domain-containing protein [Gemmatimonadota bacterium]MYB60193.1 MOSC domain-containing protein [Gemmatimonadota bacterium]
MPYISSLHVYPVKSCAGHELTRAELDTRGIRDDRSWIVVGDGGGPSGMLTQREAPALALVQPALSSGGLALSAPGMEDLTVPRIEDGLTRNVDVWGDLCDGIDQGDDAAEWFSTYLDVSCHLLYFKPDFVRPVDPDYAARPGDQVGFADGFPLLVISEASLADLNARLETPIRMNRFRPNVVVADSPPYAEDTWKHIRVGEMEIDLVKPCGRCATTLVEQESGTPGKEPLRTLAAYRKFDRPAPSFGYNAVHRSPGVLEAGMAIQILDVRESA